MIHNKPRHISSHCWQALIEHRQKIDSFKLKELFTQYPQRCETFSAKLDQLYVEYSKHYITTETITLLLSMAKNSNLSDAIQQLFSGAKINRTEDNAAMHMALRAPANKLHFVADENITELVQKELQHMQKFVESLHAGDIKGYTGKRIKTVINIGIGGSDLGPRLVSDALANFAVSDIDIHFVSNIDASEIYSVLEKSAPETTLFIISSKSFTTKETLMNAETAFRWLKNKGCNTPEIHLLAVTANASAAKTFGIKDENIFCIWPWVGGRYSIWSAIGLPVAIKIGMQNFRDFLSGAFIVDQHFCEQPLEKNLPVILALIDIWYINFFHSKNLALFPYDYPLNILPAYIGQLIMESNGKQTDNDGYKIGYDTSAVVWGSTGSTAQHAYLQCLYQGTVLIPTDFIVSIESTMGNSNHHQYMLASCLAQSETLMNGEVDDSQPCYKHIYGNRPSTTILLDKLSPTSLGSLLCLYEHRCFVQAHIWNINPFDQWGVESAKTLAKHIDNKFTGNADTVTHDQSTERLISRCLAKMKSAQKN